MQGPTRIYILTPDNWIMSIGHLLISTKVSFHFNMTNLSCFNKLGLAGHLRLISSGWLMEINSNHCNLWHCGVEVGTRCIVLMIFSISKHYQFICNLKSSLSWFTSHLESCPLPIKRNFFFIIIYNIYKQCSCQCHCYVILISSPVVRASVVSYCSLYC